MFIKVNSNVVIHVCMKYNKLKHIVLMNVVKIITQFQNKDNIVLVNVLENMPNQLKVVHAIKNVNIILKLLNKLNINIVLFNVQNNNNMKYKQKENTVLLIVHKYYIIHITKHHNV